MTKEQIEELKRLCECNDNARVSHEMFNNLLLVDIGPYHYGLEVPHKVGLYFQAANPSAILSLIAAYEKMRTALEALAVTEPVARECLAEIERSGE
jgi:hypothetical protein